MIFLCPGSVSGNEIELCPLRSLSWQTFPEKAGEDSSAFQVKLCIFIFKKWHLLNETGPVQALEFCRELTW